MVYCDIKWFSFRTCSFPLAILCTLSSYVSIFFLRHFSQAAVSIKISNLLISVTLICFVLYLKEVILSKMCILVCIVLSYYGHGDRRVGLWWVGWGLKLNMFWRSRVWEITLCPPPPPPQFFRACYGTAY